MLARREHSRLELRSKLIAKKFPPNLVDEALAQIAQKTWQSDQRFTQAYIAIRARRGYGPIRIQAELRERGIDSETIMAAIAQYEAEWPQILTDVCQKKFGSQLATDMAIRAKQLRFLQYRGFTADQIKSLF